MSEKDLNKLRFVTDGVFGTRPRVLNIEQDISDLSLLSKAELIILIKELYANNERDRDNEATVIDIIKKARAMSKEAMATYEDALATLR